MSKIAAPLPFFISPITFCDDCAPSKHREKVYRGTIENCSTGIINFKIYGNCRIVEKLSNNTICFTIVKILSLFEFLIKKRKKNSRSLLLKCSDTSAQIREGSCSTTNIETIKSEFRLDCRFRSNFLGEQHREMNDFAIIGH